MNFQRKIISLSLSFLLILMLFNLQLNNASAGDVYRLSGGNRFSTAVAISQEGWDSSDNVVICYGRGWEDAMVAAPLAKVLDCPILLSDTTTLRSETHEEMDRLNVKYVYVIGGLAVVPQVVIDEIEDTHDYISHEILAGNNREATAVAVAEMIEDLDGTFDTVVIVRRDNYVDAMAAGPFAAALGAPILYTSSGVSTLNATTKAAINSWSISKAYVIASSSVINSSALSDIDSVVGSVQRIYGSNRRETSVAIAAEWGAELGRNFNGACIAYGYDFPDALAGGALAAKENMPILLSNSDHNTLEEGAIGFLVHEGTKAYLLGGTAVLSNTLGNSVNNYVDEKASWSNNYVSTKLAYDETFDDFSNPDSTSPGTYIRNTFTAYVDNLFNNAFKVYFNSLTTPLFTDIIATDCSLNDDVGCNYDHTDLYPDFTCNINHVLHHKNIDETLDYIRDNHSTTYDLLVMTTNFDACDNSQGIAFTSDKYAVTTHMGILKPRYIRLMQHEITHTFGPDHSGNDCVDTQKCIMNKLNGGDYKIENGNDIGYNDIESWCYNCLGEFNRLNN